VKPPFEKHQDAGRIPRGSSVRVVEFKSLEQKARWLDSAASLDSLSRGVQDFARRFLQMNDAEARTRAIHRWVRDHIHYERDFRVSQGSPGEEFADTETTIARGFGDCDDKSRAFVAIVRAAEMLRPLGVQVRVRPVFMRHPLAFVHVQVEVRWPRSELSDHAQPGGWLLAEMILKYAEIGDDPDSVRRGPQGQRILA
jgi:Transglutaminase-like superfamily